MEVRVTNLTNKKQYTGRLVLYLKSTVTCHQLKTELGNAMRRQPVTLDILNVSDVLLYSDDHTFPVEDLMSITIIVHPEVRDTPDHLLTSDQDMINGAMEDHTCVLMSCGHAITPANLYEYCWNMLLQGKLVFSCPNVNSVGHTNVNICGAIWTRYEVSVKARLTEDEYAMFEMKLNHNFCRSKNDIRSCPLCGTLCERLNKTSSKVVCQECLIQGKPHYEFCWQCQKVWLTDNLVYCGNVSCETMTGMRTEQEMLRHARRKDFDGYSCPAIRMCPMCSTFLEHDAGCKHITCNCGYQFCFVCLQTWETGCDHFTNCNVAPIQNL